MNKYYNGIVSPYVLPGLKGDKIVLKPFYFKKDLPDMLALAAEAVGETTRTIAGKSRLQNRVLGRKIFCKLARDHTTATLKEIGEMLNGRDHTTVVHSIRTINELLQTDDQIREMYRRMELKII